jgi:HPt (histidine-containing phosphotransfer) domain-containing protein
LFCLITGDERFLDAAILTARHDTAEVDNDKGADKHEGGVMEESEVHWNMAKTLEQLGGDETLLQEVMDIFLEEAPKHLAALRLAVAQGTLETVETTAHTLRGELCYLGLPRISRMARELEEMGRSNNVRGAASLLSQFEADVSGLFSSIRVAKTMALERHVSSVVSSEVGQMIQPQSSSSKGQNNSSVHETPAPLLRETTVAAPCCPREVLVDQRSAPWTL